jgi:hypothetical protein
MNSGGALVRTRTRIIPVTLSVHTSAFQADDVMADTQAITNAFVDIDGTGIVQAIAVFDPDDQTAYDFDINFHRTSTSLGTENSAISISDANLYAAEVEAVALTTDDVKDFANGKAYYKRNVGLPVRSVAGSMDLYISMVCRSGTPTHAGGSIPVLVKILLD